jgi:hypothetical protein
MSTLPEQYESLGSQEYLFKGPNHCFSLQEKSQAEPKVPEAVNSLKANKVISKGVRILPGDQQLKKGSIGWSTLTLQ